VRWWFAALVLACLALSAIVAQSPAPPSMAAYERPQQLVTIAGGRRINLVCSGNGKPTVILTSGLSDWSVDWFLVQPRIGAQTRVCSWDRAGFGFSDPRREPLDIRRSSEDLAQALSRAGIDGPYILIGHSMGGLETLLLADRYRAKLAGVVLVDPTIPGQYQRFARVAPRFTAYAAEGRRAAHAAAAACAEALRSKGGGLALPKGCPPAISPTYPPSVVAALAPLQADPRRVITQSSMIEQMVASTRLAVKPRRNYGNVPLVVLSAPADDTTRPAGAPTAFSFPPGTDPRILGEVPALAAELDAGQAELARLSSAGVKREVLGAGHRIPLFRPDAVVSTVLEMVRRARERGAD
jgi:pimeloyl-ACP methyl ester carboxylesterase